ncbi:MAG: type IV pilus secretin PilQ [Acidobacteria bacterium]|nr:type IV pilus secretin PilQ [Acidobacteriota bacterium]
MKLGDDMKVKNARILKVVLAAVAVAAIGVAPALVAAETPLVVSGLRAEAGSQGPVVHLQVAGNPDTVHYSPQPGVWVVEMPAATWDADSGSITAPEAGIQRAELSAVDEFGRHATRLTVWLTEPAQLDLTPTGDGLDLVFTRTPKAETQQPAAAAADAGTQSVVPEPEKADAKDETPTEPVEDSAVAPAPATEPAAPAPAPAAPADSLLEVTPTASAQGLVVRLRGDGALTGNAFTLKNPDRVVVDLPGVINRVKRTLYRVDGTAANRVRVAQFRAVPQPITRLVVDLDGPQPYSFSSTNEGGELVVGSVDHTAVHVAAAKGIIEFSRSHPETEKTAEAAMPAPDKPAPDQSVVPPTAAERQASATQALQRHKAAAQPAADVVSDSTQVASLPPVVTDSAPAAAPAAAPKDRSPWVADPSQLIEQGAAKEIVGLPESKKGYQTKEVENEERQFTGEPITLTLKDADIKDVLRTFAQLTNLNIVVDPSVSGSVTVELHDVPWDQALDLILRINGLDYVLENNVLRVAPIAKLAAEKTAAAKFLQDQENAKPLKTVLKPLSYAQADYISTLLSKESFLLSTRGSVTVDKRTNQLIIRDTIDRVEGILRLIDSLDTPTQQVVIEGRIVETTRDFSHELGVNWGFSGVMDAAHGNDTGLNFPNNITTSGRVALERGTNGVVSVTFGDILNTFNLDFLLSAAESDGMVRIVSSPRVTTQNNQKATVRSGLQIPVQTVANNTVTVQYQDATLRLEVTPQITAEGTVMLDLAIKKQEPVTGVGVQGGTNSPIFTRDAQTKLLVRDGGTTVIAGIYQLNDQTSVNSVPVLSKIPILGFLFRNKYVFNRHDELLIFITPRIVKY